MRLPRRVPWASIVELEMVCSKIYDDENDLEAKIFAINRISAWRAITTLPHAVESTLALLTVIVQDTLNKNNSTYPRLILRQSYATAIIRLVNGLVDPLQVGTFARPITSIAEQLGLPNWLVELRHAATHEDLPSIDLLREAARQSMAWLLHNYYLPTFHPTQQQSIPGPPPRPLLPILESYKEIIKTITRDVSLLPNRKPMLTTVLRDLERWIAECKVAVITTGDVGFGDSDFKETWALQSFCDGIASKGMLVPFSKKKRQHSESFQPSKTSISHWEPLLQHVYSMHSEIPSVLCSRFISTLLSSESEIDPSYDTYLACWVNWAVDRWGTLPENSDLKRKTLTELIKCVSNLPSAQRPSAPLDLLKALSAGHQGLELFSAGLSSHESMISSQEWKSDHLHVMDRRYKLLRSTLVRENERTETKNTEIGSQHIDIPGWRILEENVDWKPCPIGVYYSKKRNENTSDVGP